MKVVTKRRTPKAKLALAREKAIEMHKRGEPILRIADTLRVEANTVRRWIRALPPVVAAEPADLPEPLEPDGKDSLEDLKRIRDRLLRQAAQADREGNARAATSLYVSAAEHANNIARLEAKQGPADGAITFTKAQLEAATKLLADRVAALMRSPEVQDRVCPACGAQIRIKWASEPAPAATQTPTSADKSASSR